MRRTNSVDLRYHLSDILNCTRYGRERIEVRRRGRILAAIVPPDDLLFLQENRAQTEQQRAARAANDLRILGFLPPPGLYAIQNGLAWRPVAGTPAAGWPDVRPPGGGLPDGPDGCDPLL
jgi:antitoxin (DNA-binding transcriptional repressor) of toxin-antitoxin stability system